MLDADFPAGTHNYWKSAFLREFTADAIAVLADAFARCPSPMTSIVINPYHGATSRVSPDRHRLPPPRSRLQRRHPHPVGRPRRHRRQHHAGPERRSTPCRPHTTDRVYVNNLSADDARVGPLRLRAELGTASSSSNGATTPTTSSTSTTTSTPAEAHGEPAPLR